MPNKKRRAKSAPALDFELPPTTIASTTNLSNTKSRLRSKRSRTARNTFESADDTPKAFTRLMAFASGARRLPKGPDNGRPPPSKKGGKTGKDGAKDGGKGGVKEGVKDSAAIAETLTIQPGESLNEFNRRVDATLPVPLKVARERRPKAPKTIPAAPESKNYKDNDFADDGDGDDNAENLPRKRRKASPDPWAVLANRAAPKFGDVAPAPPTLQMPKAVLHSRGIVGVEDVPRGAGSLARREGLAAERRGVVEGYRKIMRGRRGE